MNSIQSIYQRTIKFAAGKHSAQNQTIPGTNLPYVVHLSNVTMEIFFAAGNSVDFDESFAIQVALLHDVLEDTDTTYNEIATEFTDEIAAAVQALTKNENVIKSDRMMDSLFRIKKLRKEVWAVKLADRITNLQKPPATWDLDKVKAYHSQANIILKELQGGNQYLERRLSEKIKQYSKFFN